MSFNRLCLPDLRSLSEQHLAVIQSPRRTGLSFFQTHLRWGLLVQFCCMGSLNYATNKWD